MNVPYALRSGKNAKFPYFLRNSLSLLVPRRAFLGRLDAALSSIQARADAAEIEARAAYCCRLDPRPASAGGPSAPLPDSAPRLREQRLPWKGQVYYFDTREWLRWFPPDLRWMHFPGDVTFVPESPSVVKSRPIAEDLGPASANAASVLLNLNKIRHFTFVRDSVPDGEKRPVAVFRGKVRGKPLREAFFAANFGGPGLDLGDTSSRPARAEWGTGKLSIAEQLRYRYILSLEGNDVASNLKWIMSSNSVALAPRPCFETWFQEGLLLPGVHYAEIAPDGSDVAKVVARLEAHPEERARIVAAANAWVARFRDKSRERLVSLRVLDRYFRATTGWTGPWRDFPRPPAPRSDSASQDSGRREAALA